MGFLTHKTEVSDDLIEKGIRGRATIEKADMTGVTDYTGYMSEKKQEALLTGVRSMTTYKVHLKVEIPGREPYSATAKLAVPMSKVRYMAGGSVVEVLVDPKNNDRVAIDWNGPFEQGTMAEMAASNPLIAAAMKGAGVDVDKISQQQSAARAAGQTPGTVIMGGQLIGTVPAASTDPLDRLKKLAELRDSGVLTDAEFDAQKAKLLAE